MRVSSVALPPQGGKGFASHVFEALREVRNQVLDVLDANRYADQRIRQPDLLAQFAGDPRMGHRGRMRNQSFGSTQADRELYDLEVVEQREGLLLAAHDIESEG